jgi:hypothetical protein
MAEERGRLGIGCENPGSAAAYGGFHLHRCFQCLTIATLLAYDEPLAHPWPE